MYDVDGNGSIDLQVRIMRTLPVAAPFHPCRSGRNSPTLPSALPFPLLSLSSSSPLLSSRLLFRFLLRHYSDERDQTYFHLALSPSFITFTFYYFSSSFSSSLQLISAFPIELSELFKYFSTFICTQMHRIFLCTNQCFHLFFIHRK